MLWPCACLMFLFIQLSPWLSPMKWVATLNEPTSHLLHGVLVSTGFLVPALLFTVLINPDEARQIPS